MTHPRSDDPGASSANDGFAEPPRFDHPAPRGAGWRPIARRRLRAHIASQWFEVEADMVNDLTGEVRILWPPLPREGQSLPSQHHEVVDVAHVAWNTMER